MPSPVLCVYSCSCCCRCWCCGHCQSLLWEECVLVFDKGSTDEEWWKPVCGCPHCRVLHLECVRLSNDAVWFCKLFHSDKRLYQTPVWQDRGRYIRLGLVFGCTYSCHASWALVPARPATRNHPLSVFHPLQNISRWWVRGQGPLPATPADGHGLLSLPPLQMAMASSPCHPCRWLWPPMDGHSVINRSFLCGHSSNFTKTLILKSLLCIPRSFLYLADNRLRTTNHLHITEPMS